MRSKGWILFSQVVFALLVCPGLICHFSAPTAWGQSEEGTADLEQAFQKKIDAESTKDLDAVVKLCESAIKKGLDEGGTEQASQLAAAALYEHADQLSQRIFAGGQDPRWRVYRTNALSRLKKAVKFKPKMGEAFLMIAKLNALPGGNRKDAREAVEEAVKFAGDDREQLSTALFYRASLAEDDDEARLADLNQAIKINPENIDAIRVRSAYYLSKDDPENAIADLNKWLESDEKNSKNYIIVAQQLMSTGSKFDEQLQKEAVRILDKAIEIDPENALPHSMRARINLVAEKLDDAYQDASQAIKLDEKNYGALIIRATILAEQEKLDEALVDINAALKLQPGRVDGIQMRGMIFSQQQKFAEAIADVKSLAKYDPKNMFYQRQLAMLYNANDEPTRAIRIYDRLLKEDENGSWEGKSAGKQLVSMSRRAAALRGRGDAQLSLGGHQEAVENYGEAMKLGEAIRDLEEAEGAEEISKPDDGVLNNLAWVLATSPNDAVRDGERAIELATRAAEVTEFKQAHILSTLASGYAETGDFENAIKWVEKAIKVNKKAGEEAVDKTRTDEQRESLHKEYENYKKNEPWRELQNVEEEKKEKAKAAAKDDEEKADEDDDEENDDGAKKLSTDDQDEKKTEQEEDKKSDKLSDEDQDKDDETKKDDK